MKRLFAGAALMVGLVLSGCGTIDAAIDCQGICDRYKSCFDANYNVSACADRCRSNAKADSAYKAKSDACKSCIDTASCTAAIFSCGTNCGSIVP